MATGLAALAVAVVLVVALGDEGADRSEDAGDVASGETTVEDLRIPETTQASTVPPPPIRTTTTTIAEAAATTTSTTLPPATTTVAVTPPPDGYAFVPKPAGSPNTVAPGGALTKHLAADIAIAFGFETAEVEAAISAIDLPAEAGGNPEGWLAPGSYQPAVGATAQEVVQAMVDRRVAQLEERGIDREQWYRVLTAASVIEKETYNQNEKPNVARVLTNRLAGGGPLQMDSIILYPVPEDRIFTTSEERASDQPYNSYRHNGLPPTPICSPDEVSIDAFLSPPAGDWWFYVTIDLHTGETRYAVTYEEHKSNVELLRAWLRENPTD
jgi:UPF0755 protein